MQDRSSGVKATLSGGCSLHAPNQNGGRCKAPRSAVTSLTKSVYCRRKPVKRLKVEPFPLSSTAPPMEQEVHREAGPEYLEVVR